MTFFFVFLGFVLVGAAAAIAVLIQALSPGPDCPACGGVTIPIVLMGRLRRLPLVERRWCTGCGWEGLLRRGQRTAPPVHASDPGSTRPA